VRDAAGGGPTDAELVAGVASGDERALADLYDRHADVVFRLAFRLLGDRHLAEEVLQDTFLALWNRAELFDESVGSLSAWMLTIARHRAVDRLRWLGRRPSALPLSAATGPESEHPAEAGLEPGALVAGATRQADPDEAADAAWLRDAVRSALNGVPDAERKAIELAYYEELTQTEIADRLGWPLGTVKTRTRRALSRLRVSLADALGPEIGRRIGPVPTVDSATPTRLPERRDGWDGPGDQRAQPDRRNPGDGSRREPGRGAERGPDGPR
jgi:RNA polymerase sigma-70 factor (ECF subfamily)